MLRTSIHPYRYEDVAQSNGVAITFTDVSKVKYAALGMSVAYSELRKSINNALEALDTTEFKSKINVLVVDDQVADLKVLDYELKKISDFKVNTFVANDIQSAKTLVNVEDIDVCLVDYYLNNETALDLIHHFSESDITVPVIVLTAAVDTDLNALLLSHGVLDLIDKDDVTATLLARSIRYTIRRRQIDAKIDNVLGQASMGGLLEPE